MRFWQWVGQFLKKVSVISRCPLCSMSAIDRFDCNKFLGIIKILLTTELHIFLSFWKLMWNLTCASRWKKYLFCNFFFKIWPAYFFSFYVWFSLNVLAFLFTRFSSSHQRCSIKNGVLRNFTKFTGKHLCQSLFFNKGLQL